MSVRSHEALEQELVVRFSRRSGKRSIGVTDLISLRRAYFRLMAPGVPIPATRLARMEQGRTVHRDLGALLSREGTLEARVRRDGLVGRIDILSDVPVEVKTAATLADPGTLAASRPDHVEQLGMYCALVDRPAGRLLTLVAEGGSVTEVQALEVTFGATDRILAEMQRRADLLRTAWSAASADRLPRCPWYGRGCEFEAAGVCPCTGEETTSPLTILESATAVREQAEVEERVRNLVQGSGRPAPEPGLRRFREAIYPRRAYFDRTVPPAEAASPGPAAPAPPPSLAPDLFAQLTEVLESGPTGEVARLVPRSPDPDEEVVGFRGVPVSVKTSRAWQRYRPEDLLERSPQYALELGLRCAATGTSSGWVVLGFERAEVDRDRVQVFEVQFRSVTPFSRLLRERGKELSDAVRRRSSSELAPCPSWMTEECPYRSECGCAESGRRSTR